MDIFDSSFLYDLMAINYYLLFFLVFFIAIIFFKFKFSSNPFDKQHIFLGLFNIIFIGFVSPFSAFKGNVLSIKYHVGLFFWLQKIPVPSVISFFLQVFLILFLFDFLFYFYHRLLHQHINRFTSFHKVHHQLPLQDKNWGLALRLHFIDFFFIQFIKFLVAFLLAPNIGAWIVADFVIFFFLFFIHQDLTYTFNQKILVTFKTHDLHHQSAQKQNPCAFSLIFQLWDKIFKTEGEELFLNESGPFTQKSPGIKETFQLLYRPLCDILNHNGRRKKNPPN